MEYGEYRKATAIDERPYGDSFEDAAWIVDTFAELSGRPCPEVIRLLTTEHGDPGVTVREEIQRRGVRPFEWTDALLEFYASTDAFLFESLVWNRSQLKRTAQQWICRYLGSKLPRDARVLLYGDGLGFDSRCLARAGFRADYFEVSGKASQFARRLFARERLEIPVFENPEELSRDYDAVVCLDVLEHVPDPPSMVRQLAARLRPGGLLVVHAPFWYLTSRVQTHLRTNRKYAGDLARLYNANGLHAVDTAFMFHPLVLARSDAPISPTFGARVRIAWSRLILTIARFFALPHVLVLELLRRPDLRRWDALERLQRETVEREKIKAPSHEAARLTEATTTP